MHIQISRKQAEKIGRDKFEPWGFNEHSWGWRGNDKVSINIGSMEPHKLDQLARLLSDANERVGDKGIYGLKSVLRDIELWKQARTDAKTSATKLGFLRVIEGVLKAYLKDVPGHRVYMRKGNNWFAYYVCGMSYHKERYVQPRRGEPGYTIPAKLNLNLEYDHGVTGKCSTYVQWEGESDYKGMTLAEFLAKEGVFPETDELRAAYLEEEKRFKKWFSSIGKQLVCTGRVEFEPDEKKEKRKNDDRWWRSQTMYLDLRGARVVVDVVDESQAFGIRDVDDEDADEDSSSDDTTHESSFWQTTRPNEETGEIEEVGEPYERPIHPYLKLFHLEKHLRVTAHISQLAAYKYDTKLIDKLVIDDMRKALVKVLIGQAKSTYRDVISVKSGGAIVMLCGSPGTGKTLTAEVFAESEKRALYSVQCSQLGTTPDELEDELLKVLSRAARWNAVLLLDEADVYVHKRGTDINQNAMVGVFLRVLEYQNAVMFMTTNRASDIDDAVASRCTAKLEYVKPSYEDLCKIWRVLADTAGAKMSDATITKVAKMFPNLSGRDVKQLLKLAMLVIPDGGAIKSKTIKFVRQFKSTEE